MNNPLETLAGGDLPPSQEETRQRILAQLKYKPTPERQERIDFHNDVAENAERLDKERLARLALKGEVKWH